MKYIHSRKAAIAFAVIILALASAPARLGAADFGLYEAGTRVFGGQGFQSGPWADAAGGFATDFGQTSTIGWFPAVSAGADAVFADMDLFRLGLYAGAGFWGARLDASGGSAAERSSSTFFAAAELAPTISLLIPFDGATLDLEARLGVGLALTPIKILDEWADSSLTLTLEPEDADTPFLFAGASVGYRLTIGRVALILSLSGDLGAATFYGPAADTVLLFRAGLGLRAAYLFAPARGTRR